MDVGWSWFSCNVSQSMWLKGVTQRLWHCVSRSLHWNFQHEMRSANIANAYSHPNSNKTSLIQVIHPALEICRGFPNRLLLKPCSWPCRVSPVLLWVKTGAPWPFTLFHQRDLFECVGRNNLKLNVHNKLLYNDSQHVFLLCFVLWKSEAQLEVESRRKGVILRGVLVY